MRYINRIIVHCTATPEGRHVTVKDVDSWHRAKKWLCIGYHYLIYLDGSVHMGRPESMVGAHCNGYNKHSIGVCYVGGKSADMKEYKDTRTPEQKQALISLLKQLKAKYPNATIHGHRDFAARACPCFDAFREYKNLAVAILLVCAASLCISCRSTKRVVEEQADSALQQAVSQSVTSSTTDKFLQNIVMHIDSIVFTNLSAPQMSQAIDEQVIALAGNNSGSLPCAPDSRTSQPTPPKGGSKVLIYGISLQSITADSSSLVSVATTNNSRHSSYHSNVKAKEDKKPSNNWSIMLLLLIWTAIAVAVAIAIATKDAPIRAAVRHMLRKIWP